VERHRAGQVLPADELGEQRRVGGVEDRLARIDEEHDDHHGDLVGLVRRDYGAE
jgi:hypothetical protein